MCIRDRATGVLLRERGTLYLAEGRVVHAESPAAPGLDVLLTAHGTLSPAAWRDAVAQADERHGAARLLVDSGRLTPGILELCHLSALFDAAFFALAPSSTPGRFRYGTGHWLGPVRPVPVSALERETLRRRDLLHRIWPDPDTDSAPLARADPPRVPVLTARQQAVVALLDGVRTASDIARALGRPTFHTLVDIRRLAAAGVLRPRPETPDPGPRVPAPAEHPAADATRSAPPDPAPPDPAAPAWAPHHGDAARSAPPSPAAAPPPLPVRAGHPNPPSPAERLALDDPDVALLKRVRDALEAL